MKDSFSVVYVLKLFLTYLSMNFIGSWNINAYIINLIFLTNFSNFVILHLKEEIIF